jgi:hypothetical protein
MLFLLQCEAGIIPRGVPPLPDPGGETGSGAHSPAIERVDRSASKTYRKRGESMTCPNGAAVRHPSAVFAILSV